MIGRLCGSGRQTTVGTMSLHARRPKHALGLTKARLKRVSGRPAWCLLVRGYSPV